MGMFLQAYYKLQDKYILTLGAKAEGNSKFSKESRWGLFPTVSLAWRISEESFLKNVDFLDDVKIRGSWGQSGNTPNQNYLYFNTYSAGSDLSYMDLQGVKPRGMELTSLQWETIDQLNGGLSLYAIDNRLNIEFDVYKKTTLNLYFEDAKIPTSTGFGGYALNDGKMENRGVEFMFDYTFIKTKNWNASFNFNVSHNENVILELPANYSLKSDESMLDNGNYKIALQPGQPMGGFYGYKYLGVYKTDKDAIVRDRAGNAIYAITGDVPMNMIHGGSEGYQFMGGDAKYSDENFDGIINELDLVPLGDLNPTFMGGGGGRLKYKNFILNTFFHFKVGQEIINQTRMDTEKMYNHDNQSVHTNWRWRRQGDETKVPRALYDKGYNWMGSDRFVEDGSFLRWKTLSLSYLFGKKFCTKIKVSELKLYATAYNLYTWTNYSGQDPDVGVPSNPKKLPKDYSRTPPSKKIMLGINVTF